MKILNKNKVMDSNVTLNMSACYSQGAKDTNKHSQVKILSSSTGQTGSGRIMSAIQFQILQVLALKKKVHIGYKTKRVEREGNAVVYNFNQHTNKPEKSYLLISTDQFKALYGDNYKARLEEFNEFYNSEEQKERRRQASKTIPINKETIKKGIYKK